MYILNAFLGELQIMFAKTKNKHKPHIIPTIADTLFQKLFYIFC